MRMKILALCAVLFIACSALHFVEPAAAASHKGYLIDHGTKQFYDGISGNHYKVTWKTYWYSKNVRKVFKKYYYKEGNKWKYSYGQIVTMYKVSKTKMKLKYVYSTGGYNIYYAKTKMNTRNFYWKIYRPAIDSYPM